MTHNITISNHSCSTLYRLKEELVELQGDSEDDEEHLQPFIDVLSRILVEATLSGWHPPIERR
jgi:hypothetical protein